MLKPLQACLLDKLDDNEVEVEAVVCIMGSPAPEYATDEVRLIWHTSKHRHSS